MKYYKVYAALLLLCTSSTTLIGAENTVPSAPSTTNSSIAQAKPQHYVLETHIVKLIDEHPSAHLVFPCSLCLNIFSHCNDMMRHLKNEHKIIIRFDIMKNKKIDSYEIFPDYSTHTHHVFLSQEIFKQCAYSVLN